jgi:hypothetical protein
MGTDDRRNANDQGKDEGKRTRFAATEEHIRDLHETRTEFETLFQKLESFTAIAWESAFRDVEHRESPPETYWPAIFELYSDLQKKGAELTETLEDRINAIGFVQNYMTEQAATREATTATEQVKAIATKQTQKVAMELLKKAFIDALDQAFNVEALTTLSYEALNAKQCGIDDRWVRAVNALVSQISDLLKKMEDVQERMTELENQLERGGNNEKD